MNFATKVQNNSIGKSDRENKKTGRMTPSRYKVGFSKALEDFDGLYGLLLLFHGHLRDDDVKDAVFDFGADLLLVYVPINESLPSATFGSKLPPTKI